MSRCAWPKAGRMLMAVARLCRGGEVRINGKCCGPLPYTRQEL